MISQNDVVEFRGFEAIFVREPRMRKKMDSEIPFSFRLFNWEIPVLGFKAKVMAQISESGEINFVYLSKIGRLFRKIFSVFHTFSTDSKLILSRLNADANIDKKEMRNVLSQKLTEYFNEKALNNQAARILQEQKTIEAEKSLFEKTIRDKNQCWSNDALTLKSQYAYPPIPNECQQQRLDTYKELVIKVGKKLDEKKIPWWIDAGTLLGVYRFGDKQLPHDYDVDINTPFGYTYQLAEILMDVVRENPELYSFDDIMQDQPGYLMRLTVKGRTLPTWLGADTCKLRGEEMEMSYGTCNRSYIFPLRRAKFYDGEVWVPNNPELYLKTRYKILEPLVYWDPVTEQNVADLEHQDINDVLWRLGTGDQDEIYIPQSVEESRALKARLCPRA